MVEDRQIIKSTAKRTKCLINNNDNDDDNDNDNRKDNSSYWMITGTVWSSDKTKPYDCNVYLMDGHPMIWNCNCPDNTTVYHAMGQIEKPGIKLMCKHVVSLCVERCAELYKT